MSFRPAILVCTDDWNRILPFSSNNSESIEFFIRNNSDLRLGIYECYKNFFQIYNDHDIAFRRTLKIFSQLLMNPLDNYMSCANFTNDEIRIIASLSTLCNSFRLSFSDNETLEHTILVFVIRLLCEYDNITEIPVVKTCSSQDCPFRNHP